MATENNTFKDKVLAIKAITDDDELDMTLEGWSTDDLKRLRVPSNGASHDVMASAGFILEQRKTDASAMPQSSSQQPAGGPAPVKSIEEQLAPLEVALAVARAELKGANPHNDDEMDQCERKVRKFKSRISALRKAALLTPKIVAPARPLILGLLDETDVAFLYGPTNVGKSYVAASIAAAVSTGKMWLGFRVQSDPGTVLYFNGETSSFNSRIDGLALHMNNGGPLSNIIVQGDIPNIMDKEISDLLIQALREVTPRCKLVVFDTLATTLPCLSVDGEPLSEQIADDQQKFYKAAKHIAESVGCAVIVVHHTGKDETKGMRGSSALGAAADVVFALSEPKAENGFPYADSRGCINFKMEKPRGNGKMRKGAKFGLRLITQELLDSHAKLIAMNDLDELMGVQIDPAGGDHAPVSIDDPFTTAVVAHQRSLEWDKETIARAAGGG